MRIFFRIIFIISLSFCITSCFKYQEVEMVKVTDFGIKNITKKGVDFQVDMQLKNPNNYKISIIDSDLDLFVNGKKSGRVILTNKVTLPKKSNNIHHFLFHTDYKNLSIDPISVIGSVLGDNKTEIRFVGYIKAKAKGISKKFPVDFKEKVSL